MHKAAIALALGLGWAVQAHSALNAGDLAFTSFNADEDGFAIVALTNISAHSTIFFRDDEWNGSTIGAGGAFNTGEGQHTWNTGANVILAGTVIRFSAVDDVSRAATTGTLQSTGDTGLNATSEVLYAFVGADPDTPTSFLAAVSTDAANVATLLANTGLTIGANAVSLTASTDYAQYTGARSGQATFAGYRPLVNDPMNWNIIVGGANDTAIPNTDAFTITPVPEPSEYALMVAGLGLVAWSARRRNVRR